MLFDIKYFQLQANSDMLVAWECESGCGRDLKTIEYEYAPIARKF